MPRFIRILPLTMLVAVLFFVVKMMNVGQDWDAIFVSRGLAEQQAGGEAPKPPTTEAKPAEAKPAEAPKQEEKQDETKKEEPKKDEGKKDEAKSEEKKPEAKEGEGKGEEGKSKEKPNPAVSLTPGDLTDRHFSKSELDLLQSLAHRREDLDRWERNIQVKEEALNATEKRIDEKIQQIDAMKKAVSEVLAQYNTQEETKLKSLVKIYENMKPDDAARIFDEIEMPVLLLVIDKMAEKKAAPIMAKMDSKKAKQITVELAEQRRLNTAKLSTALPKTATP
jgi:flagellar motility protein MotE (MotC chaperone)